MRKIKISFLLVLFTFLIVSCEQDAEKVKYDGKVGRDASFASTILKRDLPATDNGLLQIPIYRGISTKEDTVVIAYTDASSLFSLESNEIIFEKGENIAYAVINYTFANLDPTKSYALVLELPEGAFTPNAGINKLTATVKMKLEYSLLGTGHLVSEFFEDEWDVDVYKAEGIEAYSLKDCYVTGYDIKFIIKDGAIICDKQNTGYNDPTYGYVYFNSESTSAPVAGGVNFDVKFTVTAGSFGVYAESLTFPVL